MSFGRIAELSYAVAVIVMITFSFVNYAPCFYVGYNFDHAIHVLMAEDLQLPRDTYFWGQRRLGSLLPLVAHAAGHVVNAHYIYITSVVHYAFLFTGFLLIASVIKDPVLRLSLCAVIFLPMNEYQALIHIGHPYSSQLFAGALFILCLAILRDRLLMKDDGAVWTIRMISLLFMATMFYGIGIWVSEFSAILAIIRSISF